MVVNKNVLGTGDLIACRAHAVSVVIVLEHSHAKSLIEFADFLPNNTRSHNTEPVKYVRCCQCPAVTGSMAPRLHSHLLHVFVFNGNYALVSRAIGHGTQQAELWMTAKMRQQIANPSVRDKSIVVQKNQIVTGCGARSPIVPRGEPEVTLVRDHSGPRSLRTPPCKKLRRAIRRPVVYHNDFHVRIMSESLDTVETHLRELALVIAQNNDADLREVAFNRGMQLCGAAFPTVVPRVGDAAFSQRRIVLCNPFSNTLNKFVAGGSESDQLLQPFNLGESDRHHRLTRAHVFPHLHRVRREGVFAYAVGKNADVEAMQIGRQRAVRNLTDHPDIWQFGEFGHIDAHHLAD